MKLVWYKRHFVLEMQLKNKKWNETFSFIHSFYK